MRKFFIKVYLKVIFPDFQDLYRISMFDSHRIHCRGSLSLKFSDTFKQVKRVVALIIFFHLVDFSLKVLPLMLLDSFLNFSVKVLCTSPYWSHLHCST